MSLHTASRGRITRMSFAAIAATAFGVPASHAQVSVKDDVPSVAVEYSDLNLGTEEGSRVLYYRLVAAAEQVCPERGYATELRRNREAQRCISDSVERAVKQIKSPRFAEVARSHMR